jgi:IclR family transcriptional regulator, KDG regulon repressor
MIKVLNKAFGIVEHVAIASPHPLSPGKLAEKLGINKATCSRIIKDLVNDGYLIQVSRLEGYTVGPRAFALTQHISYKNDIISTADPLVKECAQKTGESVLLAEVCNKRRYILMHHNFNQRMNIHLNQINYNDLWATATGIILLAYLPDKELLKILKNKPKQTLLDIAAGTLKPLNFLKNIKQKGKFCYNGDAHRLAITAFPVFKNGQFIAALGASAPVEDFTERHKDFTLQELKSTADKISSSLSSITALG